jgi:hypothetical protein
MQNDDHAGIEHVGHAGSFWEKEPAGREALVIVSWPDVGPRWLCVGAIGHAKLELEQAMEYPLDRFETLATSQWEIGPDRWHHLMRRICRVYGVAREQLRERQAVRLLHMEICEALDSGPVTRRIWEAFTEKEIIDLALLMTSTVAGVTKGLSLQMNAPNN